MARTVRIRTALDPGWSMKYRFFSTARALCSGKTLAFQANDAGSIPAARSIIPYPLLPDKDHDFCRGLAIFGLCIGTLP